MSLFRFFPLTLLFCSTLSLAAEFKVLTYNIYRKPEPFGIGGTHAAKRVKHLCKVLKDTDYDVVMLQEAWLAKDRRRLAKCGYSYTVDIGSSDSYRPGRSGRAGREQNLETGLLILSKHPIKNTIKRFYSKSGDRWRVLADGEALVSKALYAAQVEFPSKELVWFINTHLIANYCDTYPWENCNSYEDARAQQLKEVSSLVESLEGAVVLGGDLNMGPKPSSRDRIWDEFDSFFPGFLQAPHDPIKSSTSSSRNMFKVYDNGKIDHLFASKELVPSKGKVIFDQLMNIDGLSLHLSDHFGWETTFSF